MDEGTAASTASMSATRCGSCCRVRRRRSGSRACSGSVRDFDLPTTFAAFDLATAQKVFGAAGQLDAIDVIAAPGADRRASCGRGSRRRSGPAYQVQLPAEAAADTSKPVRDLLALLTQLLLGFAAIGLVVAAFIIFNTFSILVAQRTRELGSLARDGRERDAGRGVGGRRVGRRRPRPRRRSAWGSASWSRRACSSLLNEVGFERRRRCHDPRGAHGRRRRSAVGTFVTDRARRSSRPLRGGAHPADRRDRRRADAPAEAVQRPGGERARARGARTADPRLRARRSPTTHRTSWARSGSSPSAR